MPIAVTFAVLLRERVKSEGKGSGEKIDYKFFESLEAIALAWFFRGLGRVRKT